MLLNPSNGLINGLFVKFFGMEKGPFNIYSMPGLIFVEALILTPLAFLIVAAAMKSMDPSLEESAKTLGSGEFGVMRRITFPLIRPAILAAGTLNFVRAVESFDTPAIIALPARIEVFTTKIWREALGSFPTNHNLAAAYGVGILVVALGLRLSLSPLYFASGNVFHRHRQGFSAASNRARPVALRRLRRGVVPARFCWSCCRSWFCLLVAILPYYHVPTWQTWQQFDPVPFPICLGHAARPQGIHQ